MADKIIGFVVGSSRRGSYSQAIAEKAASFLPEGYQARFVKIDDLPIYSQDLDDGENVPASWIRLRKEVKVLDGVVFVTPEYNRSLPALLKNALDVASRPYGSNMWDGKPGAVISVSPGAMGGFGANHHLRQILVFLNVITLQQPEAYIGKVNDLFDDGGRLTDGSAGKFLASFMKAYVGFAARLF